MKERFKDVFYDPRYLIGSEGTILKKAYFDKKKRFRKEKRLKYHISKTTGYAMTTVANRVISMHRLIAHAFIPNPNNLKEVNHKNGNRADFSIGNLEWVTRQENQIHSWKYLNRKATWSGKTGFQHHAGRPINQYDVDGNLINIFGSASFAATSQGLHQYTIEWAIKKREGYYNGNYFSYVRPL